MSRRRADPLEREIEAALEPGRFVFDRAGFEFVADLEAVAGDVAALVETAPERAIACYEAFLAGCHEKAEEVDDSSGSFGMFVAGLFCGWIRARQAAGADAEETVARLLAWMDDDPYGFCHRLEQDAVTVLDKAGRAALTAQVEARFEQASQAAQTAEDDTRRAPAGRRRRWAEALRSLYAARCNVGAYIRLAEETGVTPRDCHAVAKMLSARRKPEEALTWVERGLALDAQTCGRFAGRELRELQVRLLGNLGRDDEAVATVWAAYRGHPSRFTYDDLLAIVPADERDGWHEWALEAAAGVGLRSHVELLLHVDEVERLAALVEGSSDDALQGVPGHLSEDAATRLEGRHPHAAAGLWRAQALSVLAAGKSKAYPGALASLERARCCYEQAGHAGEWEQLVAEVRAAHHRKTSFMPAFEELVSGTRADEQPSFLERAKARWADPRDHR